MKLKLFLPALVITVCVFIPSCEKKGDVEIKVCLPKGFSAVVRKSAEHEVSLTVWGLKHSKSRKIIDEYLFECLDVDDGVMTVKQTYKSSKVSGYRAAPEGKRGGYYEYDMNKPSDEVSGGLRFRAAELGESLIIRISPDGKTVGVDGVEAVADKLMGEMTGLEEGQREPARKRFIESLKLSRVAGLLKEYPRNARFVGQSWRTVRDTSRPLEVGKKVGKERNKFKLENISGGVATLKKKSAFKSTVTENWSGLLGAGHEKEFTLKVKGRGSSEIKVDLATGLVLYSRTIEEAGLKKYEPTSGKPRLIKSEFTHRTVTTVETIIR